MTFQKWLQTEAGRMVSFEKMPRMLEIVWNASAEAAEARVAELEARIEALEAEVIQQHHIAAKCSAECERLEHDKEKLQEVVRGLSNRLSEIVA